MMLKIVDLITACMGLGFTALFFYRIPRVDEADDTLCKPTLSIIIPARNEEKSLQLLLADLQNQTLKPLKIICVDDDSSDLTAQVACSHGVKIISLKDKPHDWLGKTWACQVGSLSAKGDYLLFLDADVRLGKRSLERLMQTQIKHGGTISVQPYHVTEFWYEQFSLIFNLIQVGGNGAALPKQKGIGLYGPIILISKDNYQKVGGHEHVRGIIAEDVALGERYKEEGLEFQLFVGDPQISYRMYAEGFSSLFEGAITGWSFTNPTMPSESRFKKITKAIETPIPDVYQCGQWTFSPSGLPVSILTGRLAADAVKKELSKK